MLKIQTLTEESFGLKGMMMQEYGKGLSVICSIILAIFSSKSLDAQWSAFKKGLQKEIQVAVESDTMLVAHYNAINFSFIVTTRETPSSDIYLDDTATAEEEGTEIWRTTERFWGRLRKKSKSIKAIFTKPFLVNLRHPATEYTKESSAQFGNALAGANSDSTEYSVRRPPPKSLLERVNEAREKGDLELASLLLIMFKDGNNDSSDSAKQAVHDELLKSLGREKALLKKLYDYALAYEQDEDWQMAAAVYENLLALGEYKDARTRFLNVLPRFQQASKSIKVQKKYREGLAALQTQDWLSAMSAFEEIVALDPNYRNAGSRLKEARAALAKDDPIATNLLSNGHVKPGIKGDSPDLNQQDDFLANRGSSSKSDLEALYSDALFYIDRQDWRRARYVLEFIEQRRPAFKNTRQLMQVVSANSSSKSRHFLLIGMIVLVIVLASYIGLLAAYPMFRARFYTLLRQYSKATILYENELQKLPGSLSIYKKLGAIYLKTGRQDSKAMRVYIMIEKLNLQIKHRHKMDELLKRFNRQK